MRHCSEYLMRRVVTWITAMFLACAIAMCGFVAGTMVGGAPAALAEREMASFEEGGGEESAP